MKKFIFVVTILVMATSLLLGSASTILSSEEYNKLGACTQESSAIEGMINISEEMLELNYKSTLELSLLYSSFYDRFIESVGEWDWEENWEDHWNLVFPNWFGGRYINEDQKAVVMVTRIDKDIITYIWEVTGNHDIIITEVKYSHAELMNSIYSLMNEFAAFSIDQYVNFL